MSIVVNQKPTDIQAAQSPIVFSVTENTSSFVTASEFQYTANLYVWSGNMNQSGSYIYQLRKYPNQAGAGIFDVSRIINSTLTDLAATSGSNIKYYKVDFGWQYATGSTYVTQSGGLTPVSCSTGGTMFKAYDGYSLFPQPINAGINNTGDFPILTDASIVTQSVYLTQPSRLGNNQRGLAIWIGAKDSTGGVPTAVSGTFRYANGTTVGAVVNISTLGTRLNTTSSTQIVHLPSAPGDYNWSTYWPTTTNLVSYTFMPYNGPVPIWVDKSLNYEVNCTYYYTPVTIAYKNRFGQFDWINFYKRHNETFNTDQRLYQPQLGSWNSNTLSYNQFQTRAQRYIVDATEVLECNTDWLQEGYNELFKQLLVADEIYWVYDQLSLQTTLVKPLTIKTNSLQFKTNVNNKLIQYTITFDIGQPYKLIL